MNPILIKLAVKLALEPDNLKKILKWIFVGIFLLLLIPAIMLITISVLFGNGSIKGDFDLTKTEAYSQVNPIYEDYMKEITKDMNAEANRIIEENTTTDVDPETGEETSECDVNVKVTVNEPGLCVLLAYLSTVNFQENKAEKYKADRGNAYYGQTACQFR
jgi:nitrogen fixation/metabolism regulation signal transduction histidine kinase